MSITCVSDFAETFGIQEAFEAGCREEGCGDEFEEMKRKPDHKSKSLFDDDSMVEATDSRPSANEHGAATGKKKGGNRKPPKPPKNPKKAKKSVPEVIEQNDGTSVSVEKDGDSIEVVSVVSEGKNKEEVEMGQESFSLVHVPTGISQSSSVARSVARSVAKFKKSLGMDENGSVVSETSKPKEGNDNASVKSAKSAKSWISGLSAKSGKSRRSSAKSATSQASAAKSVASNKSAAKSVTSNKSAARSVVSNKSASNKSASKSVNSTKSAKSDKEAEIEEPETPAEPEIQVEPEVEEREEEVEPTPEVEPEVQAKEEGDEEAAPEEHEEATTEIEVISIAEADDKEAPEVTTVVSVDSKSKQPASVASGTAVSIQIGTPDASAKAEDAAKDEVVAESEQEENVVGEEREAPEEGDREEPSELPEIKSFDSWKLSIKSSVSTDPGAQLRELRKYREKVSKAMETGECELEPVLSLESKPSEALSMDSNTDPVVDARESFAERHQAE